MRFNATKSNATLKVIDIIMSIYRSRNPLTTHYILNNHILEYVQENPYLGVIISENLKRSTYINKSVIKPIPPLDSSEGTSNIATENSKKQPMSP